MFHEEAVENVKKAAEVRAKLKERGIEMPESEKNPEDEAYIPAAMIFGNHHLLAAHKGQLDALREALSGTGAGSSRAEAFDELSRRMHDVLKGELEEEALGVFKTLVRQGDPDEPSMWKTEEAYAQLARLGVKPIEDESEKAGEAIQRPEGDKTSNLTEDALAAFKAALETDE